MSSSSDEDDANLREALAPGFTIDAVKKSLSGNGQVKPIKIEERGAKKTSSQFMAPVVSEDNQKYLAKELSKFLDSKIEEDDILRPKKCKKKRKKEHVEDDSAVRLLSSSKISLSSTQYAIDEDEILPQKPKNKRKKRKISDSEEPSESLKVQESAVSVDWVLKRKGDYGKLYRKPGELIEGATHSWDKKK